MAPDTLEAIRAGVEAGRTYGEIAADLSVTRNVVAGIVNRHCRDIVRPGGTATRRRNAGRRPNTPRSEKPPTPRPPRIRKAITVPVAAPAEDTSIECVVVPFVAATGCRWPLWSADAPLEAKAVCGARCADGHPYCAGHHRLAHHTDRRRAA